MSWTERLAPRAMPRREYLASNLVVGAVIQVALASIAAALAVSRANGHRLSGVAVAGIVTGSALLNGMLGVVVNLYSAAGDAASGRVLSDGTQLRPATRDLLAARTLWTRAALWASGGAAWSLALGLIAVAAMNRRTAGYPVLITATVLGPGVAAAVHGLAFRAEGVRTALAPGPPVRRPLRRRAWRDFALPLGALMLALNCAFSWVLFHDYPVGDITDPDVLTESVAFADAGLLVLLVAAVTAWAAGLAGRAESRLGLVEAPDEPAPYGRQALLYTGLVALFLVAPAVRFFVPELPSLWQVMVARGVLAAAVGSCCAGFSYVRGATTPVALVEAAA